MDRKTSRWLAAAAVSLHPVPGAEKGPWPTVNLDTRLFGVEDAVFADVVGEPDPVARGGQGTGCRSDLHRTDLP